MGWDGRGLPGEGLGCSPCSQLYDFSHFRAVKRVKTLPKPARGVLQLLWVLLAQEELAEQVADGAKCEISKPQKIKK